MSQEINVISRTQRIIVDPVSGNVAVINAGAVGPPGPPGSPGSADQFWLYDDGKLAPDLATTDPLRQFLVEALATASGDIHEIDMFPDYSNRLHLRSYQETEPWIQGSLGIASGLIEMLAAAGSGFGIPPVSFFNISSEYFDIGTQDEFGNVHGIYVDSENNQLITSIFPANLDPYKVISVLDYDDINGGSTYTQIINGTLINTMNQYLIASGGPGEGSMEWNVQMYGLEDDSQISFELFTEDEGQTGFDLKAFNTDSLMRFYNDGGWILIESLEGTSPSSDKGFAVSIEDGSYLGRFDMNVNWSGILLETNGEEIMIRTQDSAFVPGPGCVGFDVEEDFAAFVEGMVDFNVGGGIEFLSAYVLMEAGLSTYMNVSSSGFIEMYPEESVFIGNLNGATALILSGVGLQASRVTKTAAYTTTSNDFIVAAIANTFTIKLGNLSTAGQYQVVSNEGAGVLTVSVTTGKKLNNVSDGTAALAQGQAARYYCDGAGNWWSA